MSCIVPRLWGNGVRISPWQASWMDTHKVYEACTSSSSRCSRRACRADGRRSSLLCFQPLDFPLPSCFLSSLHMSHLSIRCNWTPIGADMLQCDSWCASSVPLLAFYQSDVPFLENIWWIASSNWCCTSTRCRSTAWSSVAADSLLNCMLIRSLYAQS